MMVLSVLLPALLPYPVQAQTPQVQPIETVRPPEYISTFSSEITIEKNTGLMIQEKIVFHTDVPRHGIYRYLPYRYTRNSVSHTANISNISVQDESGRAYQVQQTRENGFLTLRIGDPDSTFTGDKTYLLQYRVKNALQRYEAADELYWDITGEGWQFPVLSVSAVLHSSFAEVQQLRCFTGVYGSTEQDCTFELTADGGRLQTNTSVAPGSNFTIVAQLGRPNELQFPSPQEQLLAGILANWWIPVLLSPLFLFAYLWLKRGRDLMFLSPNVFLDEETAPQQVRPLLHRFRIPMVYEPFQDATPAEVGAVENERIEPREIVAEIVDLARKKYLKIESEKSSGFLGTGLGKKVTYTLHQLNGKKRASLPEHQAYLLKELFQSGTTVQLDTLHGKFTTQWQKFQTLVWESVTKKQYFREHPKKQQGIFLALAIGALALAFMIAVWVMAQWVDSPFPFFVVLIEAVPVLLLALAMPRKTARGVNIMLRARGLKATIQRGAWREKIKEKNLFIEEVLPFAVAFGVVDQLAEAMKKLGMEPPQYLGSASFAAATFQDFSRDFTQQVGSSLAYNPSSSHSSGGSGFSGGGFSGGGGGGGGGGSW